MALSLLEVIDAYDFGSFLLRTTGYATLNYGEVVLNTGPRMQGRMLLTNRATSHLPSDFGSWLMCF